jgi:plastocyanin
MQVARFVGLSGLVALLACGGSSSPTGPGGGGSSVTSVTIQDFSFSPATITVKAGTTVRWVNRGPSAHTATSDADAWDSGTLNAPSGGDGYGGGSAGGSFQFTFNQPGTYAYHCALHPPANFPGFTGSVVVNP